MKKILFLSFWLMSNSAFSYEGIITVLEAPLLKKPDLHSKVLMTLRHGQKFWIPNETDIANLGDFVQTYDRAGNIAWVPSRYVKIATNDEREELTNISIGEYDPTDYRLEEPIPSTYPFADNNYLRTNVAMTMGNNMKSPYGYTDQLNSQDFSVERGGRISVTRKVDFDLYDRYYFGFIAAISTTNNRIQFQNGNLSKENRSIIRVGPVLTYDVYKTYRHRMSLGTGFTYNFHRTSVQMSSSDGANEERFFNGYSLSPLVSTLFQATDVFPNTDLIGGADLNFFLPHTLKSNDQVTLTELWGNDSSAAISTGFKPQVSFFLGLQVHY